MLTCKDFPPAAPAGPTAIRHCGWAGGSIISLTLIYVAVVYGDHISTAAAVGIVIGVVVHEAFNSSMIYCMLEKILHAYVQLLCSDVLVHVTINLLHYLGFGMWIW